GTVDFKAGLSGTINLASGLTITKNLSITGPGASVMTVDGGGALTIFTTPTGANVTISGLTMANGSSTTTAGAISVTGQVSVAGCAFVNNAGFSGAAIDGVNAGPLTVTDCTFTGGKGGTTQQTGGGAIAFGSFGTGAPATSITITNSKFLKNTANGEGAVIA